MSFRFPDFRSAACFITMVCALGRVAAAQSTCTVVNASLDDAASIQQAGGAINGALTFIGGVSGNAVAFAGDAHITFSPGNAPSTAGAICLWLRKTGGDVSGGLMQLGRIGHPNSIGLFYVNTTDLILEARNTAADVAQVILPAVLADGAWHHFVATWRQGPSGVDLWLFHNGQFADYAFLSGTLDPSAGVFQVGRTGFYGRGTADIDEVRLWARRAHDGEAYAEMVHSAGRFVLQAPVKPASTGPVRIVNGELLVDGQPLAVRGVDYSPTPIGQWPDVQVMYSDPTILARDVPLLHALHANVIRTYSPPNDTQLLDALYGDGSDPIYAIVGFWIPTSGVDYTDPAFIAQSEQDFAAVVARFKDHPALLAWGIGNEIGLGLDPATVSGWYALAERLAETAYGIEGPAYHPCMIVNAHMLYMADTQVGSDDASLSHIDLWGHNLYIGDDDPACYFELYRAISQRPLIVTEYGIDALDHNAGLEYATVQAGYVRRQWRRLERQGLGAMAFEFSDEWWKNGTPAVHNDGGYATSYHPDGFSDEEWWGLLSAASGGGSADVLTPRAAFQTLAIEYLYAPGDADGDGDRDLHDFAALQTCLGGDGVGACGSIFDDPVDEVIDAADVANWLAGATGP